MSKNKQRATKYRSLRNRAAEKKRGANEGMVQITMRVEEDIKEHLVRIAERERTTMTGVLRRWVLEDMARGEGNLSLG